MSVLKKFSVLIVAVAVFAGITGCRSASSAPLSISEIDGATKKWTEQTERLLTAAGNQLGVPVQTQPMVHYAQWGASFYIATAEKLDTTTATDLKNGVDLGVMYVDSPGQSYPKGYYRLRGVADAQQPGDVKGTIQVISGDGRVASELPATYTVDSMEPPALARKATDISIAALPCTQPRTVINCLHLTTLTNATWRVSTTGLVVPAPVDPVLR